MSFATIVLLLAAQAQPLLAMDLDDAQERDQWGVYREGIQWTFGPCFGYLQSAGAENGSAFGGVQWRSYVTKQFGLAASLTYHREIYEDQFTNDDVEVSRVPFEMSVLYAILPGPGVRPYAIAGAGIYFVDIDYDNSALDDESEVVFGAHIGGGVEMAANDRFTLNADVRYVFLDEPNTDIEDDSFDYWQVTVGGIFRF